MKLICLQSQDRSSHGKSGGSESAQVASDGLHSGQGANDKSLEPRDEAALYMPV